ncbi:MAG TPA: bacterial transcriptional activator domain-containing protein, partial [Bacillales bacterium]
LWPGQDETSSSAGLKVAFNTLNKVLEPHRKARQSPYFIERRESSYKLSTEAGFQLDVHEFESCVQDGLKTQDKDKARQLLEKGLSHYYGDYLAERRFEDWCLEERERIQVLFLRGTERLAHLYAGSKEYDQAIRRCEDILGMDGCWEEAYRLLMMCYFHKNNRPQAIRWYRKCWRRLEKELGVEPMPATQEMYKKVLEGTESHMQRF